MSIDIGADDHSNLFFEKHQRIKKILYAAIVVLILLLSLLPELIRIGLQYRLKQHSAELAEIDDIDLNLFTGKAAIKGVRIDYDNHPTLRLGYLAVELDMSAIFRKQLLVERLALANVRAKLYEGKSGWVAVLPIPKANQPATEVKPVERSVENAWQLGVSRVQLDNVHLDAQYQGQPHQVSVDHLVLRELFMWSPGRITSLYIEGSLNDAKLDFTADLKPFAKVQSFGVDLVLTDLDLTPINGLLPDDLNTFLASLTIDTRLELTFQQNGDVSISQDGTFRLNTKNLKVNNIEAAIEDIGWQGKVAINLSKENMSTFSMNGEAMLNQLALKDATGNSVSVGSLNWRGDLDVIMAKGAKPKIELGGDLSIQALLSNQTHFQLETSLDKLLWRGNFKLNMEQPKRFNTMGALEFSQWRLIDQAIPGELAQLNSMKLYDIKSEGIDDIRLGKIELKGFEALTEASTKDASRPMASLGLLSLERISIQQTSDLEIKSVDLVDLKGTFQRLADGELATLTNWVSSLQARTRPKTEDKQTEAEERKAQAASVQGEDDTSNLKKPDHNKKSFNYSIDNIAVHGDNKIILSDLAITPNVTHSMVIKKIDIGPIDSTEKSKQTPVEAQIGLYEFGQLNVGGYVTPLRSFDEMQAKLKVDLKGVELTDLSPYLEQSTGYHAESGQVNVDSTVKINDGDLDSETSLKVLRIQLEPVDRDLIDKVSKHLTMPVSTSLNVITDSDDTLKLTIPIKGDLSNPEIQLDRIIGGAIAQSVQNAAVNYFKYAVQPFGAIILVSESIGDIALQAKFEPVRFLPGSSEIIPEQKGYLAKVAGMIKEKQEFSILVCVMVTDQDFQARPVPLVLAEGESHEWDELSKILAKSRSDLIRGRLISQHGLTPDRVQTCRPQLGKGEPRAIMGM